MKTETLDTIFKIGFLLIFVVGFPVFVIYMIKEGKKKYPYEIRQENRSYRAKAIDSIGVNDVYFKDENGRSITIHGKYQIIKEKCSNEQTQED